MLAKMWQLKNYLTLAMLISVTLGIGFCPRTWYEMSDACFKFHKEHKTWAEAEAICRNEGGYLATANTSERHKALQNLLHMHYTGFSHWIGATDYYVEGRWIWIGSGQKLSTGYTDWYPGYPTMNNKSNCLLLYPFFPNKFVDYSCNNSQPSICERPLDASLFTQVIG